MANATEHLVGRSGGHEWAVYMATSGHFCWPPVGRNYWPLTSEGTHPNTAVTMGKSAAKARKSPRGTSVGAERAKGGLSR